jgi:hypothetical protein
MRWVVILLLLLVGSTLFGNASANILKNESRFNGTEWTRYYTSNGMVNDTTAVTAPDGTNTADRIKFSGGTLENYYFYQAQPMTSGHNYTMTIESLPYSSALYIIQLTGGSAAFGNQFANVNTSSCTITRDTTGTASASMNGSWCKASLQATAIATTTTSGALVVFIVNNNATADKGPAYNSSTSYMYFWGAHSEDTTPPSGGAGIPSVTFTSNTTAGMTPVRAVQFNDTSTNITGVTIYDWRFLDVGNLPEKPCHDLTCGSSGDPITWHSFSSIRNATYAWGSGNFTITLSLYNGTWYNSTPNTTFVNVSAGRSAGFLDGTYKLFPTDSIFRANISELPIHPKNNTWIAWEKTKTQEVFGAGVTTGYKLLYYPTYTESRYFVINDTIAKQKTLNFNHTTAAGQAQYDYIPFPIPDDVVSMVGGTDHGIGLVDPTTKAVYSLTNSAKQYNGTWSMSSHMFNGSSYCYRFSAYPNGTDNGCQFLGRKWYDSTDLVTPRKEANPVYGMADAGIGIYAFTLQYDEVSTNNLDHMIWITGSEQMGGGGAWPAVGASTQTNPASKAYCPVAANCAPVGSVLRLNKTINLAARGITGRDSTNISKAMKNYGLLYMNDGGSYFATLNKQKDSRWNTTDLDQLKLLTIDDFEFVNVSSLMKSRYSTQVNGTTPVVASFTKSKTVVRFPASITFTDTSTGATSRNWSFGDGTYSEDTNPTHKYTKIGRFTVNLTVNSETSTTQVVFVTRKGPEYQLGTPLKNPLMVNCEDGTYTVSREISNMERIELELKLAEMC